jgi:hypothetical protein
MTMGRARQIVKALAQRAGIQKPISPHSLRHTLAIDTPRLGASPVVVQKCGATAICLELSAMWSTWSGGDMVQSVFPPE